MAPSAFTHHHASLRLALVVVFLVAATAHALLAGHDAQEAAHASAAHLWAQGAVPHVDFLFPHGPLAATSYAPALALGGLLGARLFALACGAAALLATMAAAQRVAGPTGALVAGAALVATPGFVAGASTISWIPLAALLVAVAVRALVGVSMHRHTVAAAALALAAGVQPMLAAALPVLFVHIALETRRRTRTLALSILAATASLAWVYSPALAHAPEALRHVLLSQPVAEGATGSLHALLLGLLALTVLLCLRPGWRRHVGYRPLATMLAGTSFAVVAARAALGAGAADGALMVLPALAVLAALVMRALMRIARESEMRALVVAALAMVLMAQATGAAAWTARSAGEGPSLQTIESASALLVKELPAGAEVLTLHPAVAHLAGLKVVAGAEAGMMGYHATMDAGEARILRSLNLALVQEQIAFQEPHALVLRPDAFTGGGLGGHALPPALEAQALEDTWALVEAGYTLKGTFGEGQGSLEVWVANPPEQA